MARKSSISGPSSLPSGPNLNRNRLMPGLRVRHDGWTEERTQRFFDSLGHTGCVRDAARVAGVSNTAASVECPPVCFGWLLTSSTAKAQL